MGRLNGRPALVTGGASGLGRAIAARLADEGASVVISDVQRDLGGHTAAQVGAQYLYQDVTSEEQWPAVLQQAAELAGPVSILVNNAGIAGAADRGAAGHTGRGRVRGRQGRCPAADQAGRPALRAGAAGHPVQLGASRRGQDAAVGRLHRPDGAASSPAPS